jgi:DNA-binding MarR family transcriptional regulator
VDLDRLANALEIFGSLAPGNMPLHHMQLVLFIKTGSEKGVTYGDIERRFRLSNAAASRSVNALSETVRHRKTALGLVEIFRDAEEGRRYRVRLTAKGAAVVRSIEAL